ncbi:MAG TPA: glycosyltransferase family 2 protein, partial [Planctomycetaceae bacterium]|nr:glycosyltransferase family 2 protein [Planctomycetaceae bacterium]
MMVLCVAATAVLAVWLAAQLYWISQFSRLLRAARASAAIEDDLPKIAVVLSLRGADPFLDRCLKGLLAQNYPRYEVQIVVDSELDPAWDLVHRLAGDCRAPFVRIEPLKVRRQTCGLRISSLIQAVSSLDETYGAVVLVDADVVPHANWLRELVGPMRDPAVGATTGIRWYMPEAHNPGTLVRYLWNAAAIPQMQAFGIGWGGSLAIRTDLLSDANLLDKWSQIMFEDTFT